MESFVSFLLNDDGQDKRNNQNKLTEQDIYELLLMDIDLINSRVHRKYRNYLKQLDLIDIAERFPLHYLKLRQYFIVALYKTGKKIGIYKAHLKNKQKSGFSGDEDEIDMNDDSEFLEDEPNFSSLFSGKSSISIDETML